MNWTFINSGSNTGDYNMQFDIGLAKNFLAGEAILRLYRWDPYCISLGANQTLDSLNQKLAFKNDIDIVVRPTGGRAVLHAEELTYSVIYPLDFSSTAKGIYHNINLALAEGLKLYHPAMSNIELENQQPDFGSIYKQESNVACFAVSAKSELKYAGRKLVGSAQRKFERVILQHGSILCGNFHKRITEFMNADAKVIDEVSKEIEDHTIEIEKITGEEINYDQLAECLFIGFEKHFNMKFREPLKPMEV